MRIGTAARLWNALEPTAAEYLQFAAVLEEQAQVVEDGMELCYSPFDVAQGLRRSIDDPPATLLVLPNGWVKVAGPLPHICADLRKNTLAEAWQAYREAWRNKDVIAAARHAVTHPAQHARANAWTSLAVANA
jgi:hypothetical protein